MTTKTMPTREEILAEPAGPRMDAWVAEYVMNWPVTKDAFGQGFARFVLKTETTTVAMQEGVGGIEVRWQPSAYISAAWEAIAAIRDKIFSKRLAFHNALREIIPTPDGGVVAWPWALMHLEPIHICRAAVAATLYPKIK